MEFLFNFISVLCRCFLQEESVSIEGGVEAARGTRVEGKKTTTLGSLRFIAYFPRHSSLDAFCHSTLDHSSCFYFILIVSPLGPS